MCRTSSAFDEIFFGREERNGEAAAVMVDVSGAGSPLAGSRSAVTRFILSALSL